MKWVLIIGGIVLAVVCLACVGIFGVTAYIAANAKPAVVEVTMATAVNDKKEPTTRVTSYPAGTSEIIAAAKVENFKSETKLQAQFFRNNDKLQDVNYDGGTAGSGWVAFSLTSSGGPLEAGDYKVEIYQDGAKVKEITFKVG